MRVGRHVGQVFLHLDIHVAPRLLKLRLIEIAVAHFTRQVADCEKVPIRNGNHAIEQSTERFAALGRGCACRTQPTFKNGHHGSDLLSNALMRFIDPEKAFLQLW